MFSAHEYTKELPVVVVRDSHKMLVKHVLTGSDILRRVSVQGYWGWSIYHIHLCCHGHTNLGQQQSMNDKAKTDKVMNMEHDVVRLETVEAKDKDED